VGKRETLCVCERERVEAKATHTWKPPRFLSSTSPATPQCPPLDLSEPPPTSKPQSSSQYLANSWQKLRFLHPPPIGNVSLPSRASLHTILTHTLGPLIRGPPSANLGMPPRTSLQGSFSVSSDANNEVVCPLKNHDGTACRKRCLGVSPFLPTCPLLPLPAPRQTSFVPRWREGRVS
jgi:hypothetical protein